MTTGQLLIRHDRLDTFGKRNIWPFVYYTLCIGLVISDASIDRIILHSPFVPVNFDKILVVVFADV